MAQLDTSELNTHRQVHLKLFFKLFLLVARHNLTILLLALLSIFRLSFKVFFAKMGSNPHLLVDLRGWGSVCQPYKHIMTIIHDSR